MKTETLGLEEGMVVTHGKHPGVARVIRVFGMSTSFVRVRRLDGSEVLVRADELTPIKTDFRIGGFACWKDPSEIHSHSADFVSGWRTKFGEGPFVVKDIQPTPDGELLTVVMSNVEHLLSGEFFIPAKK